MRKMNRLSRRLFQYVIGDRKRRRAVAFAILMKNRKPASVVIFALSELSVNCVITVVFIELFFSEKAYM